MIPKKFLGAFKKGHRNSVREFIDEEFAYKLLDRIEKGCQESLNTLIWLTQFNNEYHKAVINKNDPLAFHNTNNLRKDCNDRNYATKVDVFTRLTKFKKHGDSI